MRIWKHENTYSLWSTLNCFVIPQIKYKSSVQFDIKQYYIFIFVFQGGVGCISVMICYKVISQQTFFFPLKTSENIEQFTIIPFASPVTQHSIQAFFSSNTLNCIRNLDAGYLHTTEPTV